MEGRRFIAAMFTTQLRYSITQAVMNLPNDATEFLGPFIFFSSLQHIAAIFTHFLFKFG